MNWTTPALIATLAVAAVGSTIAVSSNTKRDAYSFFDPIVDIRAMLEEHYVEELDDDALQLGAINGMLETLEDPYTVYVPARDTAEFTKDLTGEYVGIGAEVGMRDGWFTILTPLDDSPAWRAGVMADDRVVAIDGESTEGWSTDQCIDKLMGEPDTDVTITVERSGGERTEITITRAPIHVNPVKGFARDNQGQGEWRFLLDPENGIAYVRLSQFTPDSAQELAQALNSANQAAEGGLNGLILDLRFNPGGVLEQAVRVADMFIDDGVIVSTEGRTSRERVERAHKPGTLTDLPIVVLVNGQSASASEILSGALSDHGRAIVLGTRTFGKGLVQTVRSLPGNGGVLKMTEQRYALPSGRLIQREDDSTEWGVDPTPGYFLPLTDDETIAMLSARRQQEIIALDDAPEVVGADAIVEALEDPQLAAALRVVRHRVESGTFEPVGIPANEPGDVASAAVNTIRAQRDRLLRELVRLDRRLSAAESATPEGTPDPRDLWPDDTDVRGGTVTVTDAEGNPIAVLEITGPDLERWLVDAGVRPAEGATSDETPENGP